MTRGAGRCRLRAAQVKGERRARDTHLDEVRLGGIGGARGERRAKLGRHVDGQSVTRHGRKLNEWGEKGWGVEDERDVRERTAHNDVDKFP